MKVQIEEISPIKKKLSFEIPAEKYQQALEKAYDKLKNKVNLKGFRKGKVPRSVLEQYYGGRTSMETVSELIDEAYREAVSEHKIAAVALPEVQDLKFDEKSPVTFTAEVEIRPEVTTQHYEGIKLKKKKIIVSDEEIETELTKLQKSQIQWVPAGADEVTKDGQTVQINFEGKLDGKPFEGGTAKNVSVVLGSGQFLPDFEKGLLGLKKGEQRDFDVGFPENYPAKDLAGKTAVFNAEILEIKNPEIPELDDEFAKDLGKHETLEGLKNEIKGQITEHKEKEQRAPLFNQMLDHLINKNNFDLPEAMIKNEVDFLWNTIRGQLTEQGAKPQEIVGQEKEFKEKNREEAVRRIKGFLLFDSIAQQNDLKVEEKAIDSKLEEIAKQHKQPLANIKKFYQERGLIQNIHSQLLEDKIFDFILAKAKVVEKEEKEGGWLKGKLGKLKS